MGFALGSKEVAGAILENNNTVEKTLAIAHITFTVQSSQAKSIAPVVSCYIKFPPLCLRLSLGIVKFEPCVHCTLEVFLGVAAYAVALEAYRAGVA